MNTNEKFSWRVAFSGLHMITVVIAVVLDQITKYIVRAEIARGEVIEIIPFFNLVHTQNKGAAFGMFNQASESFRLFFFGAVTVICLALLVYWLGTSPLKEKFQRFSIALILGGAIGNVIDRALFGQVTDFLDAYYGSYHWPAFNVADSAISVGVTLIFIRLIPDSFKDFFKNILGKKKRKA